MTALPSVPPEVMPTADSVADAEMLLRLAPWPRNRRDLGRLTALHTLPTVPSWEFEAEVVIRADAKRAARTARIAAHFAFTVCPLLRIPDFQSAEDR